MKGIRQVSGEGCYPRCRGQGVGPRCAQWSEGELGDPHSRQPVSRASMSVGCAGDLGGSNKASHPQRAPKGDEPACPGSQVAARWCIEGPGSFPVFALPSNVPFIHSFVRSFVSSTDKYILRPYWGLSSEHNKLLSPRNLVPVRELSHKQESKRRLSGMQRALKNYAAGGMLTVTGRAGGFGVVRAVSVLGTPEQRPKEKEGSSRAAGEEPSSCRDQ